MSRRSEPAQPATISAEDFGRTFGVSTPHVYRLMDRGDIPSVVLGRRRVIPRVVADRLLERALDGFDVDRTAEALGFAEAPADEPVPADELMSGLHAATALVSILETHQIPVDVAGQMGDEHWERLADAAQVALSPLLRSNVLTLLASRAATPGRYEGYPKAVTS